MRTQPPHSPLGDVDWAQLGQRAHSAWALFLQRNLDNTDVLGGICASLMHGAADWARTVLTDPAALARAQGAFIESQAALWQDMLAGHLPQSSPDRRFRHADWQQNAFFSALQTTYLWAARNLTDAPGQMQGLAPETRRRVEFYLRQMADALSPGNFPQLNPQVLRATVSSGGMNLVRGLERMLADLDRSGGRFAPRMSDDSAFELGVSIATTPGKVVYENRLMQLIQYTPATARTHRRPLLVIPPWINKFYIMDLQPENSLVRWWTEQGHTVFMISWVNPDASCRDVRFDDYLREGPLTALRAIEQATGEREVNAVGYCIGGTLLACTLAWLAAQADARVRSATFFASMLDFTEPGDLGVFIDEPQIAALETKMARDGVLDGADMASAFNLLRANDLIWSFFVNGYLLDRDPPAFDLLYWNADATRMPAAMHAWCLRELYLNNRLRKPGGITLADTPIDLGAVEVPCYFVATADDHIAPWRSVYAGARLLGGPLRFVLAGSGHIAGIVNPPAAGKYHYDAGARATGEPDAWLSRSQREAGSWWPDWARWIRRHAGARVDAPTPGSGALKPIEDAPGRYVRMR